MNELVLLRGLALVGIFIYIVMDYLDGRRVQDEREELIQLKSLKLAHTITIYLLTGAGTLYLIFPWLSAYYLIFALIIGSLYSEIIGKAFYRNRL